MKRTWLMTILFALMAIISVSGSAWAQDDGDPASGSDDAAENACGDDADGDDAANACGDDGAADTAAPEEVDEEAEAAAALDEVELEEEESPWSPGLIISFIALSLGGGSAVIGIWVDRDKARPVSFAYAMSFLISCAVMVGLFQGYLDSVEAIQKKQDLNRMLDMVYEIAKTSGDADLIALLEEESGEKMDFEAADPADADDAEDDDADNACGDEADNACGDEAANPCGDGAENACAGTPAN